MSDVNERGRAEIEEIIDNETDYMNGCQVVRREFFSHTFEPTVKFTYKSILFNAACLKRLSSVNYIQVLVNQEQRTMIIKFCDEDDRSAIRWCNVRKSDGKRVPREIKGNIFAAKIYDMMGWNPNYTYKMLGTIVRTNDERIIVFKFEECETFIPKEYDDAGEVRKMGRKPHYPMAWKDSFGLPVDEHTEQLKVDVLNGYARFEVVKPKPIEVKAPQPGQQESLFDNLNGGTNNG